MGESAIRNILKKAGVLMTPREDTFPSKNLRRFLLRRKEDKTGLSGIGVVAEGVEFTDGSCALKWLTPVSSMGFYPNAKAVQFIHGHGSASWIEYLD